MAIREELEDGTILEFPDGTKPEVIAKVKARHAAAAAPTSSAEGPTLGQKAMASVPGRMVMGPIMDRIDPMAEALVRGANAVGLAPESEVKRVQGINAERSQLYDQARKDTGNEGADIARAVGSLPLDLTVTRGAVGPNAFKTMPGMMKAGAATGAGVEAMAPVKGSEDMSNMDYATAKAKQMLVGGGAGALITPIAAPLTEAAIGGVSKLGNWAAQKLRGWVAPEGDPRSIVRDPETLEQFMAHQASRVGVDWAKVPEEVQASLKAAAQRATVATGQLPDIAVQNRLIAEKANLPQLTLGQASRDPVEFSREANNPDPTFRSEVLGAQQTAAAKALQEAQSVTPGAATPYVAGSQTAADIAAQAKAQRDKISGLYDKAREDPAGYQLIQNTRDFAVDAIRELKKQQLWDQVPKAFQTQLQLLVTDNGRFKLTARQAANLLQNINGQFVNGRDPKNVAMGILKEKATSLLDNAQMRDQEAGSGVLSAFNDARAARRELGKWEGSSAAVENLASKTPIPPERVYEKYIASGSIDDMKGLWNTLKPESQQLMRRQFVDDLVKKALNRTGTELTNYSSALKWLREFPREKLKLMFPDETSLQPFKHILEYVRLTKEAPPGNFVNRSNTGTMLVDALARSQNVPMIGPMLTKPLANLRTQMARTRAESGALSGEGQATDTLPIGALSQLGARLGPLVVPAVENQLGQ
jgi:hypothetical protein